MRRILPLVVVAILAILLLVRFHLPRGARAAEALAIQPTSQPATRPTKVISIDMDRAVDVALPVMKQDLQPALFKTNDGREGWVVRIPGNRPIATPAYGVVDGRGMLFVGGGYGSHEFYAFDATTGEKIWQIQTGDDGPSAAVTEDGYVAFNTESCTVLIAEAKTGKIVWQEWLGDPLMSQPAISHGKLYMAFPGGQRAKGINNAVEQQPPAPPDKPSKLSHRLLCADLKTGRHLWVQEISGDVISAPVIDGERVYLTCFDGTSYCLDGNRGDVIWQKQNAGTSAPVIANGQLVVAQKQMRAGVEYEGLRRLETAKGANTDPEAFAQAKAAYLKPGAAGNGGIAAPQAAALDSSVGFSTAPQSAALVSAMSNANVSSVAQAWAFQGSRAAYNKGQILNAQGNAVNCLDASTGQSRWQGVARGKDIGEAAQIFAPPALGAKNLYLCSTAGHLLSVSQDEGKLLFAYAFKQPMTFQPALSNGNLYAPTNNGLLICLKTNDPDATNWTAWGGNAQHNKDAAK